MTTAEIARKMVAYSNGNRHDVNHFMKVWAFAKTIGECEGLNKASQDILEIAAIVHDIACPLCREKYGNTNGKYQELEGPALVRRTSRRSQKRASGSKTCRSRGSRSRALR